MPQTFSSPLSEQDMDALEALSKKANAHGRSNGLTPLYVAIDVGDASHCDGYLLLTWPAHNSTSAHCARLIFDYIANVALVEFGATMVATTPQEAPDARGNAR
jgi:hypothetical protein